MHGNPTWSLHHKRALGGVLASAAVALVLAISPAVASADTAGPNDAGTGSSSGAGASWVNPTEITTPGGTTATSNIGLMSSSNYLWGTGYGFNLPGAATIDGIQVTINRTSGLEILPPGVTDQVVRLTKDGSTFVGSNYASGTSWGGLTLSTASYGGAADLWGTTWTAAEVNSSSFGVGIQAQNANPLLSYVASVDYVRVSVTYHDGSAPATATVDVPVSGSSYTSQTVPATFSGRAADNPGGFGLGADTTTFTLQRPGNDYYWNGSTWQSGVFDLATTHSSTTSGTTTPWTDNAALPDWSVESTGTYTVTAKATDLDGNVLTGPATVFTLVNTWDITVLPPVNGHIVAEGPTTVVENEDATFTVMPDPGFHVDTVTVDGLPVSLVDGQYVFHKVTGPHTIAATFAPDSWFTVWRFRSNRTIGNYLWTRDAAERDAVIATLRSVWTYEGPAFHINASNSDNKDMMWRFRNRNDWTYFYTADPVERDNIVHNMSTTWELEGPTWAVSRTKATATPVWRFRCLHNSTHLWTADPVEKNRIDTTLKADYALEGVAYWLGQ